MKFEISRQSLETDSNIEFHENPCSGSRVVPIRMDWQMDRRTDGHDEINSHF